MQIGRASVIEVLCINRREDAVYTYQLSSHSHTDAKLDTDRPDAPWMITMEK